MAITRAEIEKLAPNSVERKAAESAFLGDQFIEAVVWKSANADNYMGNGTYSWNDYGDLEDAQDLEFGAEYEVRNNAVEQYTTKVKEFGDAYTINKMMARSVGDDYEAGQVAQKVKVVRKSLAKRFLFGTGEGAQIKGMDAYATELGREGASVQVLSTEKFTVNKAQEIVKWFNDLTAQLNVVPDTIICHRSLLPIFETTQMLLSRDANPIEFQKTMYKQFLGVKIVPLDFDEFNGTDGSGNTISKVYVCKWNEDDGVYGILPPDGKILEVGLADLNDPAVRNPKGNVACVCAFVPYNKRAFIKGSVITANA